MPTPNPALAAARSYCGWHVTPEDVTEAVLDGPGGTLLALPTLHLVDLESITEDGVALDLSTLEWSPTGVVRKKSGMTWTRALGGITVSMNHGYSAADDFDQAVSMIADTLESTIRDDAALTSKKVGDVEYQWAVSLSTGIGPASGILDKYKLPGLP